MQERLLVHVKLPWNVQQATAATESKSNKGLSQHQYHMIRPKGSR